ncbi:nuclear transport factor 2 family protein [Amycolatopsis sp. NPDC089917]|uniref:nuclear transport factor 2 family protein n=1 Tax=Amycolatopsis sp. NPDC089917 TaxID=3155187 RepID=UPI003433306B
MNSFNGTDPKKFIADFPRSFHDELVNSSPMGQRMDRDKLIAHTRPVRKNRPSGRMEVREAVANGDRIAARMRRGHCAGSSPKRSRTSPSKKRATNSCRGRERAVQGAGCAAVLDGPSPSRRRG